jgi:hypothetical protein
MKHPTLVRFAAIAALSLVAPVMDAAPSLAITRNMTAFPYAGPLWPQYAGTGPRGDPHASVGMWFLNTGANSVSSRSHELHDEPIGNTPGPSAIYGRVFDFGRSTNGTRMTSFTLEVIIVNKTFSSIATAYQYYGDNVQGERRKNSAVYAMLIKDPVLTLEFVSRAKTDGRYVADSQDLLAFYNGNSVDKNQGYFVPGWTFGSPGTTLGVGQQSVRKYIKIWLNVVGGVAQGIDINGSEARAISQFRLGNLDLLGNPARSLKIARYPVSWSPSTSWTSTTHFPNNASVFHNR